MPHCLHPPLLSLPHLPLRCSRLAGDTILGAENAALTKNNNTKHKVPVLLIQMRLVRSWCVAESRTRGWAPSLHGLVVCSRRCMSSPSTSEGMSSHPSATATEAQTSSTNPSAKSRGFVSRTAFTLSPSQVTDANVPSARDVAAMIPSVKELNSQLPGARELESQYIGGVRAATAAPDKSGNSFFPSTTDPLEDFIEGTANDSEQKPTSVHVLLAYRALLWGTIYAVIGVSLTVFVAMRCCGFHTLNELMIGVREKVARDEARLRASTESEAGDTEPVRHYVIDLTRPSEAVDQIREIWAAVQNIADAEAEKGGEGSSSSSV